MLDIITPSNMHGHLRRAAMLRLALPHSARQFQFETVMPNTQPGIYTAADIQAYEAEILEALDQARETDGVNYQYKPLMVLYITPQTTRKMIEEAFEAGAVAGKLYPRGGTTNSEDGIEYYWQLSSVFQKMSDLGMLLLIHGEVVRYEEDIRELMFLPILDEIASAFPKLKIVLEHISNFESIGVVKAHENVAATITLHHILLTATDMMGEKFHAQKYWKPRPKKEHDRRFIEYTALSGHPRFFYGTDSAPHPVGAKRCDECCAGVFSQPVALARLAEAFDHRGALDKLEPFVSLFGPAWYGIEPDRTKRTYLKPEGWKVPPMYEVPHGDNTLSVVPFLAGQTMKWKVV